MLKIILCDDDPYIISISKNIIRALIEKYGLDAMIVCEAKNGNEINSFITVNEGFFLIFLDLDFGKGYINGMDIAKAIRLSERNCKIVFTTNHNEMAIEVLKSGVEPYGFLEKNIDIKKLEQGYKKYICMALNDIHAKENGKEVELHVLADEKVRISIDDIVYIETEKGISHGITYHTINGSILTVIGNLEDVRIQLGDDFIRTHRSFLINKRYILCVRENSILMSTQEEIPCSFRLRNEVKKCIKSR